MEVKKMINKIKLISVTGNIGSGKTTLTQMLSKHYKWIPQFDETENPYLTDFYNDMAKWSFNVQIYFLNKRLRSLLDIEKGTATFIQDKTIYEDVFVFASCLKEINLLNERDYNTYHALFGTINNMIKPPDLIIYLKASVHTLVEQIQKRGRDYEENIRLDYLKRLNNHYEDWITNFKKAPILTINVDENKFADNTVDFKNIIKKINIILKLK